MGTWAITNTKLHRIKVRLFPNNLPAAKGAYYARVSNDTALSIENVAAALKTRGGFTGSYDDLVKHVRQFLDEVAYQLCDGFAVNMGYFSIHPNVGGYFKTTHENYSADKHPVSFHFRSLGPLSELTKYISIEIEGGGDACGYIISFLDVNSGTVNRKVTPGGLFSAVGRKIKLTGDDPACGVYFVSVAEPEKYYRVAGSLAENSSVKLIGLAPAMPAGEYALEVRTQYTIGSIHLKEPRVIKGNFTLTAG